MAYKKNEAPIWGVTVQNEPSTGFWKWNWQTAGFTAAMERDFIKTNLGPALKQAGYGNVSLMIMDDQRFYLPGFADEVRIDRN